MSKSFLFLKCFFCLIFLFQHSLTHPSLRLEYLNMQITEKLAKNTCTCFRNIVSNTCPVCRDQISNKDEFWEFADIPDQKLFYRSLIEIAASGNSWDFLQCFSKTEWKSHLIMRCMKYWTCSETVVGRCSVKKVFRKFLQNSHENTCVRVCNLLKKRLWHRCFPLNFGKYFRAPFFIEDLQWLIPLLDKILKEK